MYSNPDLNPSKLPPQSQNENLKIYH